MIKSTQLKRILLTGNFLSIVESNESYCDKGLRIT
jgi:hypothetical protein